MESRPQVSLRRGESWVASSAHCNAGSTGTLATQRAAVSLGGVRIETFASTWPDRLLARKYVWRAAAFWAAVHLFLWVVSGGEVIGLDPVAALALAAMGGWLGVFDAMKRDELPFLRNLGVYPSTVAAVWICVTVTLEVAAHVGSRYLT